MHKPSVVLDSSVVARGLPPRFFEQRGDAAGPSVIVQASRAFTGASDGGTFSLGRFGFHGNSSGVVRDSFVFQRGEDAFKNPFAAVAAEERFPGAFEMWPQFNLSVPSRWQISTPSSSCSQ